MEDNATARSVPGRYGGKVVGESPRPRELRPLWGSIRRIQVLLVEDNRDLRDSIQKNFSRSGFHTDSYSSASAAIERAHEQHYDVLVSEVRLPGISGISLAKSVRKISRSTRLILIAGDRERSTLEEAMAAGVEELLEKPLDLKDLCDMVAGRSRARLAEFGDR